MFRRCLRETRDLLSLERFQEEWPPRIHQTHLIDHESLISDLVHFLVSLSADMNAAFGVQIWRRRHSWRSAIHVSTD